MAKAVSSSSSVTIAGDGEADSFTDSPPLQNATGISPTGQVLASGNQTITVPAGAQGVTIVPPAGNTVLITIKGVGGDTGLTLHLTQSFRWAFPAGAAPASFVLSAASAMTAPTRFLWG